MQTSNVGKSSPWRWVNAIVAVVTIAIVVPHCVLHSKARRDAAIRAAKAQIASLSEAQTQALDAAFEVEKQIAALRQQVREANASCDDVERKRSADDALALDAEITAYGLRLKDDLAALEHEVTLRFQRLRTAISSWKYRFVVKWHSDDGVQTSTPFEAEDLALEKFNDIGEFAKKLLMFTGTEWTVVRSYGGEQWLNCMKDDATIQVGDCKPTKAAKTIKDDGAQ